MTYFLGLTGGIATGKSTADHFFLKKNIPIIDTDQIAHALMAKNQASYQAIIRHFGKGILAEDGEIDRKKLSAIVFNDKNQLNRLNELTHPLILNNMKEKMIQYQAQDIPFVILDIPLLFEGNLTSYCTATLLITAPFQLELSRLMARNNLNEVDARKRIASQMPLAKKEKLADYVIENSGTINDLENKLSSLLEEIGR
ncbi:dephospho-CoA kinase [Lactobacillus sp.]|uniref:dephospho-CoA kinase n=1 Tax=Lactobacillus sp. TaxID=1591 RepID=UPI0019A60387|nr:dephospho-CoA kinase [Lactobacillus sp.]MBD5429041.1 dephospho-CoA kinase [Lactobacillus sp.]MBD5430257.1 dephospho-CoA kinase [Lactobacillus sp.]